jgi:hypothetical protein
MKIFVLSHLLEFNNFINNTILQGLLNVRLNCSYYNIILNHIGRYGDKNLKRGMSLPTSKTKYQSVANLSQILTIRVVPYVNVRDF